MKVHQVIRVFGVAIILIIFITGTSLSAPFQFTELDIDFRDWVGADWQNSIAIGNVTVAALNAGSRSPHFLYQDSIDGLGIRGGEHDEIDITEYLRIQFSTPLNLHGFGVNDLFGAPDGGGPGFGEMGFARFYDSSYISIGEISFQGINSTGSNGEQYVEFAATA